MPRRQIKKKRAVITDPVYNNRLIELVVCQLMRQGKKSLAYRIIYESMNKLAEKTQKDPLIIIEQAIRNLIPLVEVQARRIRGSTYQVPLEVQSERGIALAIRWIVTAARKRTAKTMVQKLTSELFEASKKSGGAIRKRDQVQKMAEKNKGFAKFRY